MDEDGPSCERCGTSLASGAAYCGRCGHASARGLIGRTLAERYRLVAFVGAGGMGRVYRAEHLALERVVAVKVLSGELAASEDMLERFRREAVATSRLAHPNVVAALDFGVWDGLAYFVMEWIPGRGLDAELRAHGRMPPARALAIAHQVASALGAAHAARIVHRDIKPANVMLVDGTEDTVKVVDFGLAQLRTRDPRGRLTRVGSAMGTPAYLAPEQIAGEIVGPAADIYALGGVLFEMLTGEPPFGTGDPLTLVKRHLQRPPQAPSHHRPELEVPELDALVLRMLAKRADQRPPSGQAAAEEIAAVLARLSGPSPTHPVATTARAVLVADIGVRDDDVRDDEVAITRAIETAGGTVARAVGDELFGHFASSEGAVHAALAIARSVVGGDARLAVHEGDVLVGAGGGLFGPVVNTALRIARLGSPGAVLVTEVAVRSAGLTVATLLRPHGKVRLGARSTPIELFVIADSATSPAAIPSVVGHQEGTEVVFRCACGARGRIAAGDRHGAECRARCARCSQPLTVLLDVAPPAATRDAETPPAGSLDSIVVAAADAQE